ncbi:MAG: PilZ domain-containing protein [Pseudomonadota bacterium]
MEFKGPIDTADRTFPAERRNVQRRQLVYYLRAWDIDNSQMLGHIVDFTNHGLMLISEEPIQIGGEYSLEVRLPDSQGDIRPINFRAVCRWSGSKPNKPFFDAGFEVLEKASDEINTLHSMTNAYGFGI